MKQKYILILLLVGLTLIYANKLALITITPEQKYEASKNNIQIYYDFQDALLVRLNDKLEQIIQTKNWQYKILDPRITSDEYFLVYIVGIGKSRYPGKYLWKNEQAVLVRMSEAEALQAKAQGFFLRKLRPYPLSQNLAKDEFCQLPYDPLIGQMVGQVTLDSLVATLYHLQNYGTRYTYSPKCDSAARWLYNRFQSYNLATENNVYLAGPQRDTSYNVIATITGQVRPESIVIICGHFDSYSNMPYTQAPGADDNASGTAVVLEAARILSRYRFRWTIKFIGFSGEEQWMLGSYHYVDSVVVPQQLKIGGVFNFDMIAYTAYDSTRLYINHNLASTSLAVLAESANVQYNIGLNLIKYWDEDCPGDNAPFWARGYKAVFALEDSVWGIWNGSNPHYHTTHDTVGNLRLGQVLRGAKLGVACVAMMAKPIGLNLIQEEPTIVSHSAYFLPTIVQNNIILPANRYAQLYDVTGKKVGQLCAGNNNISHLAAGIYFVRIGQGQQIRKIIIQR